MKSITKSLKQFALAFSPPIFSQSCLMEVRNKTAFNIIFISTLFYTNWGYYQIIKVAQKQHQDEEDK